MSGISSAIGYYLIGKQTAKGAVATAFKKYRAAGAAAFAPVKERAVYTMTDIGRDQADSYTTGVRVEGDVPIYLHPDGAAFPFWLALGTNVDSGTTPNFTHTLTPADDLPWFTVWRQVGNVITEQFLDCKLNTLRIESSAGAPPMLTLGMLGITPSWTVEPTKTDVTGDPYKHWEGKSLFQVGGAARVIHDWSFEINNNLLPYQADDWLLSDIDPGKREISFSFAMHFEGPTSEPKYREFFYGSDVGTTIDPNVVAKAVDFIVRRDANTEVRIALPQVRYSAVPVNMDPSGDPIDVEVACNVEKPSGSPIATVTVKDQNTSVP